MTGRQGSGGAKPPDAPPWADLSMSEEELRSHELGATVVFVAAMAFFDFALTVWIERLFQ